MRHQERTWHITPDTVIKTFIYTEAMLITISPCTDTWALLIMSDVFGTGDFWDASLTLSSQHWPALGIQMHATAKTKSYPQLIDQMNQNGSI